MPGESGCQPVTLPSVAGVLWLMVAGGRVLLAAPGSLWCVLLIGWVCGHCCRWLFLIRTVCVDRSVVDAR